MMVDLTKEQQTRFAIFSVSPDRYGKVAKVVNLLPHKWLIGKFAGQLELSVLLPLDAFHNWQAFLMEGQESFLELGPASHRDGTRKADLVHSDYREHLPPFRQVQTVAAEQDWSFDPATGAYYATPERSEP